MTSNSADEKRQAHELIERLEPSQITTAIRFLEFMLLDPVLMAIATAPVESEPLTEEERQAIARSELWFRTRGGKGIPMDEVVADFGLTIDDFPPDQE